GASNTPTRPLDHRRAVLLPGVHRLRHGLINPVPQTVRNIRVRLAFKDERVHAMQVALVIPTGLGDTARRDTLRIQVVTHRRLKRGTFTLRRVSHVSSPSGVPRGRPEPAWPVGDPSI